MTNSIIKILLIGDYSIFRSALRMLIETDNRLRVIGEADRLDAAADIIKVESPDIVLADLPDARAWEVLPLFRNMKPPVLVLIGEHDVEIYKKCLQLGISGLVLKEDKTEILFKAIEKIHEGELWFDRTMMGETIRQLIGESQMLREYPKTNLATTLTDREKEVVKLLCMGMKTRDIADSLFITENTVRHHLTSVFNKLDIKGRLELVIYAFKNGLAVLPHVNGGKHGNGNGNGNANGNGNGRSRDLSQGLNV